MRRQASVYWMPGEMRLEDHGMKVDYRVLADSIKRCSACIFINPSIEPLVPPYVDVPVPIMFIGENPSWADDQDVPFADSTISRQALQSHYLHPLGLSRNQVWITDMIKCRYPKYIHHAKPRYKEEIQSVAEACSRLWLLKEIEFAQPSIVVTLSDSQVYQRFRRAFALDIPAKFSEAVARPHKVVVARQRITLFPMIHPDISRPIGEGDDRKKIARAKWAQKHQSEHIPVLREILSRQE